MPHSRNRYIISRIEQLLSFWPVVGVQGLRQVGKTTLLQQALPNRQYVTLDQEDALSDAMNSGTAFLGKLTPPATIDEAQKAPPLFDAIKLLVDKKRIPGTYLLTGSAAFSAKIGIRESLTGRIGLCRLRPFTLSEGDHLPLADKKLLKTTPPQNKTPRLPLEQFANRMIKGGMPTPMFARDEEMRRMFWQGWLDTTVFRDLARVFGKGYDPEIALRILREMGKALREGELPTHQHFSTPAKKLMAYLTAMEDIFIIDRCVAHEAAVARDAWLPSDSGLTGHLMDAIHGDGATLSLARVFLRNELACLREYHGISPEKSYYKSARGTPIDFLWDGYPCKIVVTHKGLGWEERALQGAMKALKVDQGFLVGPFSTPTWEKKGISRIPWTYWS